jgi:hypothetical protein
MSQIGLQNRPQDRYLLKVRNNLKTLTIQKKR